LDLLLHSGITARPDGLFIITPRNGANVRRELVVSPGRAGGGTIGGATRRGRRRFLSPSWVPPTFTYAEVSWTLALADWIGAHTRAFAAIGGVPNLLVPDNTKVAVIKACLYEPQVNRTYAEMAAHYDTAILRARPRRPRDKDRPFSRLLKIRLFNKIRRNRPFGLRPRWMHSERVSAPAGTHPCQAGAAAGTVNETILQFAIEPPYRQPPGSLLATHVTPVYVLLAPSGERTVESA